MLLGEYSVRTGKTPQQHKSTYTTWSGGGGNVCNVCRVGEERKSVSLHCTPGVYSSNSLAKATVGEPEKDKIVLSLGRVNIPIFAGYSLSILTILVSF